MDPCRVQKAIGTTTAHILVLIVFDISPLRTRSKLLNLLEYSRIMQHFYLWMPVRAYMNHLIIHPTRRSSIAHFMRADIVYLVNDKTLLTCENHL